MTDNVPLIFDAQDNKIKELPIGNNLDLTASGISNLDSLTVNGFLAANSIEVDGNTLGIVAFTNNYEDLDNTPTGFTGDYNDLINRPNVPSLLKNLNDVSEETPTDGSALIYNVTEGVYKPSKIVKPADLDQITLGSLSNVITQGTNVTDRFLKFTAGAWRPTKVQYAELQDKPTNVSFFANDAGYITSSDIQEIQGDFQGSVFADDSSLLVDGVTGKLVGNVDTSLVENTSGNLNINSDNYVIIDSTTNGQIEIGRASGVGNVIIGNTGNGTDVDIAGRLFLTGNGVPTSSVGSDGDFEGLFAVDDSYIYYCIGTYDSVTDIWRRTPWAESSW